MACSGPLADSWRAARGACICATHLLGIGNTWYGHTHIISHNVHLFICKFLAIYSPYLARQCEIWAVICVIKFWPKFVFVFAMCYIGQPYTESLYYTTLLYIANRGRWCTYHRLDISRYIMTGYCTQRNNIECKLSVRFRIHKRHPYLALGELCVCFVSYLEKSDRDKWGTYCICGRTLCHEYTCKYPSSWSFSPISRRTADYKVRHVSSKLRWSTYIITFHSPNDAIQNGRLVVDKSRGTLVKHKQ